MSWLRKALYEIAVGAVAGVILLVPIYVIVLGELI